ncbi:MAG: hypothetical protein ABW318_11405, partial [Vicinamibacterales bacterium]
MRRVLVGLTLCVGLSASAWADDARQLGKIGGVVKRAQQLSELHMSEAEEQQLGAAVSERVRTRYGVVQDANVHRYVALVG